VRSICWQAALCYAADGAAKAKAGRTLAVCSLGLKDHDRCVWRPVTCSMLWLSVL